MVLRHGRIDPWPVAGFLKQRSFMIRQRVITAIACASPGFAFHVVWDTCKTYEDALAACDPHRERVWEETSDADESALLVSRDYKVDTAGWRMAHFSIAELAQHRDLGNRSHP